MNDYSFIKESIEKLINAIYTKHILNYEFIRNKYKCEYEKYNKQHLLPEWIEKPIDSYIEEDNKDIRDNAKNKTENNNLIEANNKITNLNTNNINNANTNEDNNNINMKKLSNNNNSISTNTNNNNNNTNRKIKRKKSNNIGNRSNYNNNNQHLNQYNQNNTSAISQPINIIDYFPYTDSLIKNLTYIKSTYNNTNSNNNINNSQDNIMYMSSLIKVSNRINLIKTKVNSILKNNFYSKLHKKKKSNNPNYISVIDLNDHISNEKSFEEKIKNKLIKSLKLDSKILNKKKNNTKIILNRIKCKKEEHLLLKSFFCVLCRDSPRNVLPECGHLMLCEFCVENIRICPKCGLNVNVNEVAKIYRC